MCESFLLRAGKRQPAEQLSRCVCEASEPQLKKQKLVHPSESETPAEFWDNLSKIWLTKRALRELDRRTKQTAARLPKLPYRQQHKPVARSSFAKWQEDQRCTVPGEDTVPDRSPGTRNIKIFARHGGPDLSDLKGYRKPANPHRDGMSPSQSSSRSRKRNLAKSSASNLTANTTSTKSTGPYDRAFQQNLIDGGIYPDGYEYPNGQAPPYPANWEELKERLARTRRSLSPSNFSNAEFGKFRRVDVHAFKEKQITTSVIPIIEGDPQDPKCVSGGIAFTNLDHLTDGTLKPGNPDLYYGARPEQIARRIHIELSGRIQPTTQEDSPYLPNFFLAAKGPEETGAVAKRQACYDGALGARGMLSLQSYGQEDLNCDGNAYTITSSYSDGQLKMYTSHPIKGTEANGRPEYAMTQINTWGMTGNLATFCEGASAFRNARDWTKEKRNIAIECANARARESGEVPIPPSFRPTSSFASETSDNEAHVDQITTQGSLTSLRAGSSTTAHIQESESSADELALDFKNRKNSTRKRLKRPRRS